MLQANEALKILVGYGDPLIGRILTFDAQSTEFGELKLRRDPACLTCGVAVGELKELLPEPAVANPGSIASVG